MNSHFTIHSHRIEVNDIEDSETLMLLPIIHFRLLSLLAADHT